MKKILAYLLVLVSLMTLFCGTAGAEETGAKEIYFTIAILKNPVNNHQQ